MAEDGSTSIPTEGEGNPEQKQKHEQQEEGEVAESPSFAKNKVPKQVNETRSNEIEQKISETSDRVEQRLSSSVTSQLEVKKTKKSRRYQRVKYEDSDDSDSNEPFEEEEEEDENEEEGEDEEGGEIESSTDERDNNDEEKEEQDEVDDNEEIDEIQTAEAAEALYQKKLDLIDGYLIAKKDYKYLLKKNAYLQDKLYKICVRKGFIVENKGDEEDEKRKKKNGKRKFSIKPTQDEEMFDEDEEAWEAAMAEHNEINRQGGTVRSGELKNFFEAALENKYIKIIKKIWGAEQSKLKNSDTHDMNLSKIREKSEKWEKIHQEKFLHLMDRVREASDICLDSNTGQHIPRWETEQYIEEVSKIHAKFCKTLCKMYSNRHGLEFALKRLAETEVQGDGLQMLEYEQLQAENYSLKEKLEDRLKDVENIKAKIAHAVQILAHFRECLQKLQEKMDDGNSKLALINKRVYQVREISDVVTQRYEVFKEEQKNLISESGLLDNTKLLRDFEKTHYDVMDLKEEKRKLQKQLATKMREVQEILSKIKNVQMNLPELQQLQKKDKVTSQPIKNSIMSSSAQNQDVQKRASQKQDDNELDKKRMDRLQFLLEHRNLDPKPSQKLNRPRKFPRIVEPYKCHFQQI